MWDTLSLGRWQAALRPVLDLAARQLEVVFALRVLLDGAQDVFPDYTIGVDGVRFSMPANSDEIIKTHKGL